jgi:hypothetical protein
MERERVRQRASGCGVAEEELQEEETRNYE